MQRGPCVRLCVRPIGDRRHRHPGAAMEGARAALAKALRRAKPSQRSVLDDVAFTMQIDAVVVDSHLENC